ncbi:transcription termination factor NusA [Desulfocicer niacini]
MLITDIKRVIDQVSREKGISREVLVVTLKEAIESAARKKLGPRADVEVHYDDKTGEVDVFQFKEVVENVQDPDIELTYEEGLGYDAECEIGDSLGIKVDTSSFGRIAAQSAKQVIIQKMKEAEKSAVYENFIHKKGEIINGIVQRVDRGNIIVNLGQAEAILTSREQIPREMYRRGDRIRAYVLDVLEDARGSQILLSRTHPEFLVKLFATEVPEIAESIVTIRGAAREAGVRSKIAVSSTDSDVDPVGACVGMKGNRVQSIVQELRGEKIDIVQWNPDVAKFVCNALAPAEVARVIIDEDNKNMEIIVVDDYLSIAIGKNGQNVRLACRLTGWHLEVMSEDEYSRSLKKGYDSLMDIPHVTLSMAEALYKNGFCSSADVASGGKENLVSILELPEADVTQLIEDAQKIASGGKAVPVELTSSDDIEQEIAESDAQISVSESDDDDDDEADDVK